MGNNPRLLVLPQRHYPDRISRFLKLHTRHKTAAQILTDKGTDYLLPVKGLPAGTEH